MLSLAFTRQQYECIRFNISRTWRNRKRHAVSLADTINMQESRFAVSIVVNERDSDWLRLVHLAQSLEHTGQGCMIDGIRISHRSPPQKTIPARPKTGDGQLHGVTARCERKTWA
jgi:hypothetical protein